MGCDWQALGVPEPEAEDLDDETVKFWNQLSFRYKVKYDDGGEGGAAEGAGDLVFGHMRQKVRARSLVIFSCCHSLPSHTGASPPFMPHSRMFLLP